MPQTRTVRIDGTALADIRTSRGLTITRLAKMIGRHRQSINKLETGRSTHASGVFAHQLANALKINVAEITLTEPADAADGEQPEDVAA